MPRLEVRKVGEVFVPGGLPTVTYNPRPALRIEERISDYLDERLKILSLSGSTKCGKTVLLKTLLPDAVWLSGGSLTSADTFWSDLAFHLNLFTEDTVEESVSDATSKGKNLGAGAKPFGIGISGSKTTEKESQTSRSVTKARSQSVRNVVEQALKVHRVPIIVDDFHYISSDAQLDIVRGLKDIVFEGAPIIFVSVPHRAYDAVRVEQEFTGRIEHVQIPLWSYAELEAIAYDGFGALNVVGRPSEVVPLAEQSFGSPHLMQELCLQLCKSQGIRKTCAQPQTITYADSQFYRDRAPATSKSAFDLLVRGPRQRTDRKQRTLIDGTVVDIYGAILSAIAYCGASNQIKYEQLRLSLRKVLADDPPQRHEVTRVLEEMSIIARDQIEGEPVLDYDKELAILHISDPFFAYFLKWGTADIFPIV